MSKAEDRRAALKWFYEIGRNVFCVIDTETTGVDEDAEVIEISIIDKWGRVLLDTLVKPTVPIPPQATQVHGITDEMVKEAPSWPEVWPKVREIFLNHIVLIYNAAFDVRLIHQTCEKHNLEKLDFVSECVMLQYAKYYGKWNEKRQCYRWQKLTNALAQQNIPFDSSKAHRALADCYMTLELIKRLFRVASHSFSYSSSSLTS